MEHLYTVKIAYNVKHDKSFWCVDRWIGKLQMYADYYDYWTDDGISEHCFEGITKEQVENLQLRIIRCKLHNKIKLLSVE